MPRHFLKFTYNTHDTNLTGDDMSEPDHFSTVLDVEAHEQLHDHSGYEGEHTGADGYGDSHEPEVEPRKKKSLPTPVLIIGGMAAFIALGAGYQHFFGARPQTEISAPPPVTASAETGGMIAANSGQQTPPLPSPARSGGFPNDAANPPPLPAGMRPSATDPIGPVPSAESARLTPQPSAATQIASAQSPMDMGTSTGTPNPGGASMTGNAATAPPYPSATPAPENAPSMISAADPAVAASMPLTSLTPAQAPDPRDAEIAQLKTELKEAKAHHGATPRHAPRRLVRVQHAAPASDAATAAASGTAASTAASTVASTAASADAASGDSASQAASNPHRVRHSVRGKHARLEALAGYRIKQVIPGQGWVEDEQTGKQQVVSVGDKIGQAQVTKIDPDTYRIETTAGVIQ